LTQPLRSVISLFIVAPATLFDNQLAKSGRKDDAFEFRKFLPFFS